MKIGDICAVELNDPDKPWLFFYLAKVLEFEEDTAIQRVRVIGESFDRDDWNYIATISGEHQSTALKLAAEQWQSVTPYRDAEALRAAILAKETA